MVLSLMFLLPPGARIMSASARTFAYQSVFVRGQIYPALEPRIAVVPAGGKSAECGAQLRRSVVTLQSDGISYHRILCGLILARMRSMCPRIRKRAAYQEMGVYCRARSPAPYKSRGRAARCLCSPALQQQHRGKSALPQQWLALKR